MFVYVRGGGTTFWCCLSKRLQNDAKSKYWMVMYFADISKFQNISKRISLKEIKNHFGLRFTFVSTCRIASLARSIGRISGATYRRTCRFLPSPLIGRKHGRSTSALSACHQPNSGRNIQRRSQSAFLIRAYLCTYIFAIAA